MKGAELYLERYAWPGPVIKEHPDINLEMGVVVPVYNEPHILKALQALKNCSLPDCHVEVLPVINHPEDAPPAVVKRSEETFEEIQSWSDGAEKSRIKFFPVWAGGLKKKFAGPGLARKIGMDETVRRIKQAGKPNGLIVSYDADCICDENYLTEIFNLYKSTKNFRGCAVYYEHVPEPGKAYLSVHIINYELHLRYYSHALAYAGYPYSFHTIGSTMVVTTGAYIQVGGMNRRKAGEDFFFLQKIFPAGDFYHLNSTAVYPSSRVSDRVPFGTGATMLKLAGTDDTEYLTYNTETFQELKQFLELVPICYQTGFDNISERLEGLPPAIRTWLQMNDFAGHLARINNNAASGKSFFKGFYQWFNRFQVLKFVHFARDYFYPNIDVVEALNVLMPHIDPAWSMIDDRTVLLNAMRRQDRG